MAEATHSLRHRAEELASTLPPLLVAAERVASTVAQGVHGRRRVGQGETFWQFRRYEMGDQPQMIDWRKTAKSDRVFVREMEWEAAQSTWIWRDTSASMAWRSDKGLPEKKERADLLALALAVLLVRGGEHVALLRSGYRPSSNRITLNRIADQIAAEEPDPDNLPPVLPLPRYGQVIFVGDFLSPLEEIHRVMRTYAESGVKGYLLQVLDPAEETLPYHGRVRFEGLEGEGNWLLSRVETARSDYLSRLEAHQAGLQSLCRSLDWGLGQHRTDRPAQSALLQVYVALSHSERR